MFAVYGLFNVVQTGTSTVGSIGYTGLKTFGIVSSGPSQENINNEENYRKLKKDAQIATKREENSKKRKEEKDRRAQQNAQRKIEAAKEAEEQKIKIAKTFSPGLENNGLKKFIKENKDVIDIVIELNNFVDNILSENNISTKCFQIDKKLVEKLAAVLNKNNIILLKKIAYFEEAYKIVANKIKIPGQLFGTRSFQNNNININSNNYKKLINKESIAHQICMQIAIKYGVNEKKIHFDNPC
jgi:hypothetical protein